MDPVAKVIEGQPDVIYHGPPGTDIRDLSVCQFGGYLISRWKPDAHERELIAQGGDVFLLIEGDAQPPVLITAETPMTSITTGTVGFVGRPPGPTEKPAPLSRDRDDLPSQPERFHG